LPAAPLGHSLAVPSSPSAVQVRRPAGRALSILIGEETKETLMLLWIAIIIAVLWLLGLLANIGGGLIHLLLVIAVVVLIFHFIRGRSRA